MLELAEGGKEVTERFLHLTVNIYGYVLMCHDSGRVHIYLPVGEDYTIFL